ncbi:cyclic nucleotide-binding protein [Niastella yeongjuensis]|uniref:Cyclic nucleotide-binding protein n=1 Tax=Niastella yeongjuensis TaxID=354355 RepID=A0A1V9DXN9_9BACT|nr:Crp/Fnr family transcriptional regulator [Niastella yeongjuensis]OQP38643.1 cyclic nucleotide-binding protein [Niastella yeongjuensis]SEO38314.1 cAMP-binding domain of CRP or a regulatory subunit of cAMP-dependent protein kinases [Niastella yeongjuensis]
MHETLLSYIREHSATPLTDTEIEVIKAVFVPRQIKKRQFFLKEGEVCKYSAFIVKGAMRQYRVDDKGVEHILRLSIENWWVSDRESYIMLTPSRYYIDAWEDCELLTLTRADFLDKLSLIPAINEMAKKMDENFAIAAQRRVSSISLSAEERYAELVQTYPEFLQRFPQHLIASYLGITRETLSRLRSHAARK